MNRARMPFAIAGVLVAGAVLAQASRAAAPAVTAPVVPAADAAAPGKSAPSAAAATPPAPDAATDRAHVPAVDQIELGTTEISGNRELPKLLYVVPWRRDPIGPFAGRPPNSLVDEALTPVDRDVFERQNRYYAALQSGIPSAGAAAAGVPTGATATGASAGPAAAGVPAGTAAPEASAGAAARDEK